MPNVIDQPISEERVKECEVSAKFWASELGPFAHRMRKRADSFALASTIISAITGLGVWATLATSTHWLAILTVSVVSIASAVLSYIPKAYGYGQCAEDASLLGPRYGNVFGDLMDVLAMLKKGDPNAQSLAAQAIKEFEEIKAKKDALKPFPNDLQDKIDKIREQR